MIFANGGMEVPVSNGGGPFIVVDVDVAEALKVIVMPDMVVTFKPVDDPEEPPEVEVEVVVICGEAPGNEGVGGLEGEGGEGEGGGGVGVGVGGGCLFKRRSRCLALSFSAFIKEESCKAEKKTRA